MGQCQGRSSGFIAAGRAEIAAMAMGDEVKEGGQRVEVMVGGKDHQAVHAIIISPLNSSIKEEILSQNP